MKLLPELRAAALAAVILAGVAGAQAQDAAPPPTQAANVGRYVPTYLRLADDTQALIITDTTTGESRVAFMVYRKENGSGMRDAFGAPFAKLKAESATTLASTDDLPGFGSVLVSFYNRTFHAGPVTRALNAADSLPSGSTVTVPIPAK